MVRVFRFHLVFHHNSWNSIVLNKLSKLMPKQRILNVIIYMKHDNITTCMMLACGTNNNFFWWWCIVYCMKHQPCICKWNLMAHIKGWGSLGYPFAKSCLGVLDSLMAPWSNPQSLLEWGLPYMVERVKEDLCNE